VVHYGLSHYVTRLLWERLSGLPTCVCRLLSLSYIPYNFTIRFGADLSDVAGGSCKGAQRLGILL
jgi:hypothetical protein